MDTTESAESAHSPARSPSRSRCPPPAQPGSEGFWRPWVRTPGEKEELAEPRAAEVLPSGPGMIEASRKLLQYQHPVSVPRLFGWERKMNWKERLVLEQLFHLASCEGLDFKTTILVHF
ncbi:protein ripply2 isoform X2 [Rattus norvegicus]|uniref:protein ripply2 isoform X2 n=1 Tax=Rattus norvegicus TaxID=10116 RepID=UPI0008102031|eukprot:XP_017451598.1 PREDICTED: protein ripply2 isoform X2 [Rattus norvegicus]